MAGLHFPITSDNSSFMRAIHEVTAGVQDASRQIELNGGNIDRVISQIKGGLATLGVGLGFKELTGQIFETRAQFEQLEIAFTTMLGSADKANSLLNQLKQTAAKTPFKMEEVVGGAKSLLAYCIEAEKVNDTLIRLGDIASGLSIPLNDLIYLYGTTMVQGRMFTQDFRQFQGRGIPIAEELSKVLGVAKEKVGDAVTAGKVGAKELEQAIIGLTSEGGKFGSLMAKQSDSLKGKWENIKDTIGLMFNEMGQQTSGVMNLTLDATASIVDHWQEVITVLGSVAAAYGAQKAYLMLDSAFTAAKTDFGYTAEIEQLQALIPAKKEAAKTDLEQAVASGQLTEAKAAQIASMREEAEEYVKTLALKAEEARQAEITAQANLTTALQEKKIADDWVQAAQEKWEAAYDTADAIAEEAASIELETAKTIQSEAVDAVAEATKEAKAASSAHVAAQQAAETASTQLNTAQTAGNTAATNILTIAKERLALVMAKVNAVMAANKYAIIIGAVIALGYAVYKLTTYQDDYQKSLSRLDDVNKSYNESVIKEQHQIDVLFGKLKNAKKGTQEWKDAKDAIWKQYGSYLKSLGDEATALNDVAKAYDLVSQAAIRSAKSRALSKYLEGEDDKYVEDQANNYEKVRNVIAEKKGERFAEIHDQDIRDIVEGRKKVDKKFLDQFSQVTSTVTPGGYSFTREYNPLAAVIGVADKRRENYNKAVKAGEDRFGIKRGDILSDTSDDSQPSKNLQSVYDEASKNYQAATKKVEAMKKNRKAYTEKEWEKAQEDLKSAKDAYEKAGGETKTKKIGSGATAAQIESKQDNAHQKFLDLMKQQAEERLKQEQDYEYQRWQTRIDLMDEGEKKVIAQMELDQSKERASLEEQKKQAIQAEIQRQKALFDARQDEKAAGNKKYAKQVFDPNTDVDQSEIKKIADRYQALQDDLTAKQEKAEKDRLESAKESMNNYLKEFGSYQQKRKAIEDEYAKKISEAPNNGERKIAIAQRDKAYADLDFNEWQDGGGMALAFGDVSKLSHDTIRSLIKDMEESRSKIVATFDPDKIQKYEEALNNLRMVDVDAGFFFDDNDITESLKERLVLEQQIRDVEENIAVQQAQKDQMTQELNTLNESMLAGSLNTTAIGPDGQPAQQNPGPSGEDVKRAEELRVKINAADKSLTQSTKDAKRLRSELNGMRKVKFADIQKFSKNLTKVGKNAAELAGLFSDDVADAIEEGADKIGIMFDAFSELGTNIEALSKSGKDTVKGTADAAKGIVDGTSTEMKATAATTATSLSTMEKASAILAIIGAAIQLATMMVSLFSSDKKHEKRIAELQERIDSLKDSYEDLQDAADKAYSSDASALIEKQNQNLRLQNELIKQQKKEEEAKKKSDKDKQKEYDDAIRENKKKIEENKQKAKEAIIGDDIKSAIKEFASAYTEAWDDGTDAAQASMKAVKSIVSSALEELIKKNIQPAAQRFYDALASAMEDGVLTDDELARLDALKAQMDVAAAASEEQYKKIQERYKTLDELREELTDISFDSVRDNFKSLMTDMESTTEDFTNNFTDMLRNALIEGLMDSKYDALLKDWYANFAEAMDDQKLTDEERERLRQQYQAIIDQGIADRNAVNDIIGGGAYSQQASEGEAWGMTQETGEELNGRFTAMVELQATNNTLVGQGNSLAIGILSTLQSLAAAQNTVAGNGDNETLLSIRDMMFLSTGHLEDIAKYTKRLQTMSDDMAKIKEKIENI